MLSRNSTPDLEGGLTAQEVAAKMDELKAERGRELERELRAVAVAELLAERAVPRQRAARCAALRATGVTILEDVWKACPGLDPAFRSADADPVLLLPPFSADKDSVLVTGWDSGRAETRRFSSPFLMAPNRRTWVLSDRSWVSIDLPKDVDEARAALVAAGVTFSDEVLPALGDQRGTPVSSLLGRYISDGARW